MKKKLLTVISILVLALLIFPSEFLKANAELDKQFLTDSVFLTETGSGEVLYAKNENERKTIASMTKIMLLNLCFEAIDSGKLKFDETITVSKNASGMGGSQVFLEKNGKYKLKYFFYFFNPVHLALLYAVSMLK